MQTFKLRQRLAYLSLRYPPLFDLLKLSYSIAEKLVKIVYRLNGFDIYTRNSMYKGTLVPPISDIDFSVVILEEKDGPRTVKLHQTLKNVIPLLGELNVLNPRKITFKDLINPLEQQRDPCLLPITNRQPCYEEKIIYLSRMLMSDRHNLFSSTWTREKKWSKHLQEVGLVSVREVGGYANLSQLICSGFPELRSFLNNGLRSLTAQDFFSLETVLWVSKSIHDFEFEKSLDEISQYPQIAHRLAFYQIAWEVFGCWTQRFVLQRDSILKHINNLSLVVDKLNIEEELKILYRSSLWEI